MGKKSSKTPDVKGAAREEAALSKDLNRDQTYANRPDQYNALGNNTWQQEMVKDPATGEETTKWTQRQNLSPDMQDIFNNQQSRAKDLTGAAAGMGDRINEEMGAPLDWNQFGDVMAGPEGGDNTQNRQRAEDAAYDRSTSRLDPQFEKKRGDLERQMAGRGLRAGDSAFDSAMANYDRSSTDAYADARYSSVGEGRMEDEQAFRQGMDSNERSNALRQQQIQEYLGKRGQSLKESNALNESAGVGDLGKNYGGG